MNIILIRHGKPNFDTRQWVNGYGVGHTLQQYRDARVTTGPLDDTLMQGGDTSSYFMTSELARAKDSLNQCKQTASEISELLNEAELPHPNRLVVPLPWTVLLFVCRVGWLLGYRSNAPGRICDCKRAKQAAALLTNRATEHGNVYVVGHGIMNRLIIRELMKINWTIQSKTGTKYWNTTVMLPTGL